MCAAMRSCYFSLLIIYDGMCIYDKTVMPRTLSPSPKMDPLASLTSSLREILLHGSTTPPSVRDVSSDLPIRMDLLRQNVAFTSKERKEPLIETFGRRGLSKILPLTMKRLILSSLAKKQSLQYMLLGVSFARVWKRSFPNTRNQLVCQCTNLGVTKRGSLSVKI